MTNEVVNVPELRFPEFDEEWKKKKLDDIANYRRGSFPQPYGNKEWYDEKNGEPFVQVVDVDKNMKLHDQTKQKISDLAKPKSVKGFKGDIVVTLQGSIGRVALLHYDAYIDRTLLLIDSFKIEMNKNYFKYVLYLLFLKEKERAPGGTIKTITKKVLSNFKIDIPNVGEQEKIGEFFSKLDQQIELEEQKLEKLEEQKKGYMQQIFSQELRFKDEDGNIYPDWKEYVLGETGNTYSGLSSKTKEDFGYGDSYFITYMNVFKNTIAKVNMIEKVNIQENEKQNKVNYKDILFTTSSEVPEETGMSSIWLYKESNVYLNSFCFGFRVTCDDIEPIYLTRFLRSEKMRKQITILSQGSTRFNISKKEVMKLKIDVPNLEEQTKIVNFLSKYDSLIESQSSKIDLLKERKKGFLQKMFV
ncbi:restriction endonuclease subunit S [Staphylococcus condimenti]|uniref:restriction endonuclease subunit S n=1 Tax=Staphylococcus condimenti TaxID=70255 RepID=UPI00194E6399|nr:restriction endonuclease subunit S [Staphylococcus condimenti]QRP95236.1 restriction endonuclease subunit S [Staphylococcus condimenti]